MSSRSCAGTALRCPSSARYPVYYLLPCVYNPCIPNPIWMLEYLPHFLTLVEIARTYYKPASITQLSPRSTKAIGMLPEPAERTGLRADAFEAKAQLSDPVEAYQNLEQDIDQRLYRYRVLRAYVLTYLRTMAIRPVITPSTRSTTSRPII